jgi:hypothetical protein
MRDETKFCIISCTASGSKLMPRTFSRRRSSSTFGLSKVSPSPRSASFEPLAVHCAEIQQRLPRRQLGAPLERLSVKVKVCRERSHGGARQVRLGFRKSHPPPVLRTDRSIHARQLGAPLERLSVKVKELGRRRQDGGRVVGGRDRNAGRDKRTRPSRVCLSRTSESLSTRRTSASSLVRYTSPAEDFLELMIQSLCQRLMAHTSRE